MVDLAGDAPPLEDQLYYYDFVINMLNHFDTVTENATRLAVVIAADATVAAPILLSDTSLTTAAREERINVTMNNLNGGLLDLTAALNFVRNTVFQASNGHRLDATKVVIYLSSIASTMNSEFVAEEAREAHSEGIRIYSIGVGSSTYTAGSTALLELQTVASDPRIEDEAYFIVDNFASLDGERVNIAQTVCTAEPAFVPRMTSSCIASAFRLPLPLLH